MPYLVGISMSLHTNLISDLQFQLCICLSIFRVLVYVYLTRPRKKKQYLSRYSWLLNLKRWMFYKTLASKVSLCTIFDHQWAAVRVISMCIGSSAIFIICYEDKILKNWHLQMRIWKSNFSWVVLIMERSRLKFLFFKKYMYMHRRVHSCYFSSILLQMDFILQDFKIPICRWTGL